MLNCSKSSLLASRALDEKLSLRNRLLLKIHLIICNSCRKFSQQLTFLRDATQHANAHSLFKLSDSARQRIADAIKSER